MKKWIIAGVATVAVVGTGLGVAAYAHGPKKQSFDDRFDRMIERVQYSDQKGWRGPRRPISAEDRAAFLDARIAAVKAGLKLSAEQEKLWGPVETTVRELGKKWGDRFAARRDEWQKRREAMQEARKDGKEPPAVDHVDRLRKRADSLAERSADMKRFADAAQPLYATLDEGQKRRLQTLIQSRRAGMMHRWHHRDRDDGPRRG
jgi:hypothetical protein